MDVQKTSGKPFVTLQSVAEEIERPLFIDTIHSSNSDNEPCYSDSEPEARSSTITSGADSDAESLGESSSQRQSSVEQDLQFSLKEVEQTFETISTFDTPVKEEEKSTITSGADTPALSETSELTQPSVDGKTKLPPQRPPPPVKRSADLQTSSDFMPNELLSKTEPPIRPPPPSNFALTTDELAHISMIQKMSAVDSIVQPEKISEYVDAKLERQSSGETSSADSQQQESMDRSISSVTSGADENSIDFSDFDYDDQQSAMKIEDRVQRLRSAHHYRSFYESPGNINEGPFFAKLMEPQPTITEQTPEFNQIKLDYVEQFVSNTTDLPTVMSNFAFVHEETESSLASSEGEIADYGQEDEDYELSEHSPSESPQIGELNEVERRHIEDVKKIAAQLSTNAFDNVYQDIAANEMYARRLAKWKAQAQQSEELELNYDEEELPVCVDEKQEVDIVESLTANVFDTATSEVLFAIPIERKLSSQQQESMVQFTEEELEHFARIQQMAEQMDGFIIPIFQAPEIVDVPEQTQSDSLTEEELQHIARVQQMADDISLIDTQQPLFNVQPKTSQFTLEKQSSSLTSGADEISERESVTDVSIENVPKVVQRQSSEQSTVTSGADEMSDSEVPVPEYAEFESPETTQEEPLVHILDRLESSSPIDVQTVSSELQSEPVLEFVSEPQTRMLNEQVEVLHQSFQYATYDSPDAQNDGPFETENIKVKSSVATKEVVEELTQEELDHIARIQQMAETMGTIDPIAQFEQLQTATEKSTKTMLLDIEVSEIEVQPKSEASTPTSSADSQVDASFDEGERFELDTEEVITQTAIKERFERLRHLSYLPTYESPGNHGDGPFEATTIELEVPVKLEPIDKDVVEELTKEELDHIARIQQMAEQMDTFYMSSERKSRNLTIDESTNHTSLDLPIPNVEETKSEGSTPTSSADSQVDASFDESEKMQSVEDELSIVQTSMQYDCDLLIHQSQQATYEVTEVQSNGPFKTENITIEAENPVAIKEVVEELTQEELEHIARIQQMAEQMSRFDTQYSSDVQPKTSQFTLEKQSSSLTSGADEISERESVTDVSIENVPKVVQRQSSEQSTVTSGADEMSDSEVPVPEYLDQFLQKLEDPELPDAMREGLNANEYGHIELIKQAAIEQQKLLHKDHLEETSDRSAADSEAEDQLSSMQMVADKIAAFDSLQYSMPTRAFAHEISMDVNVASEASSEVQQFSPSSSTSNYKAASVKSEDSFEKPELSDAEEKSERQPVIFVNPSIMSIEVEDYDLPTAMREGLTAAEFGHIELIKQAGIEETRSTVEFATIKNANFQVSVESSPPTSGADTESERESPSIDPFVPIKEELEVKTPATSSTEIWAFEKTADTQLEDVQLLTDQLSTIETVNNKLEDRSTDIDRHELAGVLELSKPVKSEVENIVDESKLTLEEIDHIERVRRLAEEMDVDSSLQFSPLDWFNSTERTITREHVTRRPVLSTSTSGADELDSPTDFEENETPTPNVEAEESCYVQNVQQSVDIEWQNWRPITPLEVIHEVAESTEINEKIGETNWPKVEIQIDAKPESVEDNLDFMETSQELIQSQLVPQAETTTSIAIKLSTKLTAEELEHIARIQQMAEQMGGFDVPIFSAQPIAVETTEIKEPQYTQPSDLSAAELEHINQIEFMAEQMSIFDSLPESSKFPLERQSKSLTSGADEEILNEDESERNDYEDLRNAISAEYPKSPSEDFEIEQRIVQQPSITSTATSGADATISTTTINESVDEAENESFLTADYRPEKRASWANIEERESEPDLGALEIERIKRLRRAAEEMEMNDTEAYQLFDQLVDKREESPDKLSNELKSVSPIDVHIVNSEVLTKPILGFATEPQTKKIRNQIQRLKHISYRATYESPGNHGDGPFEATLIDMKLPLRLESEDKDVVEELTEEELKQIDIYSRQQSFVEHQGSSSTSGADMETMPSVDIEETIFEQTSIKERFERLRHLSYLPTYESPGNHGDGPFEATTIELEVPVKLEPIDKDVVEELTKEELDHIARIQQMAEQMSMFDTQYSSDVQPKTSQFTLEKQSSSLTSGADEISERESVTDVSIENVPKVVQRQSSEQSTLTSGADEMSDSEVPVPEYAEFESPETTQEEPLVHILDRLESSSPIDVQTVSSELQSEPVLEFVSEPQTRMLNEQVEVLHQSFQYATYDSPDAQNDGPFETENIKVKSSVATKEVVEELTQEELDHIARIQQMAEHMNAFDPFAQFESKEPGVEGWTSPMMADLNVPKSKASTPTSADSHIEALTSFDESEKMETFVQTAINEHTEPVHQQMQISVYETANDDVSSFKTETIEIKAGKTTLTKDVVQELTPEELEHIARIQRMAEEMDSIPDPAFRITNQIQSSKLEKTSELLPIDFSQQKLQHQESSATSGADMESVPSFEEPTPIHDTTTVELTAEELAHIAKIQQMAEQIDLMPFDNVQLPDFNSTPFVEPESELTQKELEHIAKVTQMAENWANFGTTIQEQPIASEFSIKEPQTLLSDGSETDDSLRREEEPLITPTDEMNVQSLVFEPPRRINPFITRQPTKPELKPVAPVKIEEPELTLEEINHIEQIRRMAEMSMADTADLVFPIPPAVSHLPQQLSIKSVESSTRHSSSATSGADSERSDKSPDLIVGDSFEDRELLEKPAFEEQTTTELLQIAEDLHDDLEHSTVTSSADSETALSFDMEEKETSIPRSIQEPVETDLNVVETNLQNTETISRQLTASSVTSGADSDPINRRLSPTEIFGDSFEDEALLPSEPTIQFDSTTHRVQDQNSLNDQWPGTELTAESSEEMEMLETKIPIETREFDSTAQTKDERTTVQKSFDHHYRLPSTVDEIDLVVDETPEKSEISKPYDWRSAIQQSSQTTISYTDRLRRSLPHEYIHSSYSVEETRFKRRLTEKSSSVQIIYPQSLTADQRKLSWTAETTSRRSIPTITTTQPAVEPTINPFEECERRSVQQSGSMLCNIDFMVKLNFLARRITENIAEAAADDLSKVIQMKSNPRARYFGDDYLLEFLDSQADDEIPTFDMKLDYEVETIHEDAIERPAFDIFGMFRRKSTVERPRSALAFLQQRRYSPLPVPEVSSRKGSEVRSGDIMHLLHRTSIGSTESSRADSSFNLPIDALENLSAEEREHIQRVMANASRSHTTPQDSRRSSSAMRSLPSMDELSEKERQHISEVMLKAEQRQAPFIISPSINKSRSTGDRLDEQARELLPTIESMDKPEIISESSLQETQQLTEAELLQIAQVQERIAAVEAEDKKRTREAEIAKIENEFRASKAAITTADATATQQKSSSFGGFRMGIGSLKSALKKTQQKVNENVNSIVQSTNQVIDKPTESLRKLGPTPKLEPTNEMETPADDRAKSPTFELDYTPKFTHPIESMENEPSALFLQSTLDLETATSPPSSGSSSTESADRSLNELDDAVVYADENIAWLQERIEAMNQTLEAYETEEISPNEDANSQRQNEFAVDEQTAANGMMESVDAKWPEDLVGEADDETDFYEHEVRLRAAKETKRDGRRAGGDEEAAAVAFLGHANRPEKDEKDEKTTEEARNTVATTTFGGEESPRNELPSALPTSSDSATPIQSSTITPDRSFGGMFSSGKSTGFGGFGGFGKLASGALKGAKQASEQLQAKAQQAAQIAQQAASTGDLTQIGSQLTAPTRPSRSQSAANMNAEPTTPAIGPTAVMPGMEHLSEEERMKIMAVMACAEIDSTQPVQSKVVEKPSNEPTAKEIAEAAALGLDEEALRGLSAEEREQIISVMKMAAADDVEVTTKPIGSLASTISPTTTGIATERPISPKPSDEQPRVSSAVKSGYVTAPSSTISSHSMDQPLVNDIVQTEPLVDREEKLEADYYLVDSESYDKHLNKPLNTEPLIIQQEPPSLYSDYEQMGPELSTIVEDVQEPQIEDDDLWIQQPRQEYRWDEGNHQRAGRMWETVFTDDGDMAASEYDEIQPHVSYEQRDPSPIIWQANSAQLPQQEQAELIYESQDQQNRMELYGRTADGSFEVQMEDPLSPTTMIVSSTLAENAVAKAEREITKRTPEITVTQEEEDSDAETSPSDEDDYPDQVIAAPTAPMTPNQMEKQEQENADAAQEVLRQIQSFGEAADDEFDVRWASSMNKKEQSIEPTVTKLEEPKAEPAKRINPFLDSPEDEEPEVTVEQVNLDSDDVEYNQAVHSYYKNSELYHRPGPVYTIPEGDEGTSPKPNRESRYNPQLLERRPLHGTTVPSLVPVDMKRKPKDPIIIPTTTSTTGSQIATTTSVTTSNGPITPIRTAPPPPTDKVDETENQQRRHVHQGAGHFTTDIPQPDDFIPIHTTEPPPSCVAPSDAAFLEQTFGSRVAESSTLGSQLPSADHAVHDVTEEDQTTPR
ncbi:Tag-80 [Aphelenchoides besseyi]|nr:Tag-80 [Aphelenchoides besseyi]